MDGLLAGDTALVTGGANGIGLGIATEIARQGARVAIADVNAQAGEAAARTLGAHTDVTFLAADLRSREEADRLAARAIETLGQVSILVHAASPRRAETDTVFGVDDATFDAMFAVNVTAGFRLAQRIGRHMIDRRLAGRMLFTTSLHAERPRNLPHYAAAKAGLTMIVKECARALGQHGIRVNALVPGAIATGGVVTDPAIAKKIPLGRPGTPDDIAPMAVVMLCDRFSRYMTGASVVVDGGLDLYSWFDPPDIR